MKSTHADPPPPPIYDFRVPHNAICFPHKILHEFCLFSISLRDDCLSQGKLKTTLMQTFVGENKVCHWERIDPWPPSN